MTGTVRRFDAGSLATNGPILSGSRFDKCRVETETAPCALRMLRRHE